MNTLLSLTKKRDDAVRAVASATNDKARAKASSDLEAASLALARFQASLESKTVKVSKKEEKYEEVDDEEEEEESEEEEDDEPKKPMEDSDEEEEEEEDDDDSDDDDDDDGDDDDEEEEEEEEDDEEEEEEEKCRAAAVSAARASLRLAKRSKSPKAVAAARASLKSTKLAVASPSSHAKLRAAVARVTGKKSLRSMLGALAGLAASAKKTEELSARVDRSERRIRRSAIDSMLKDARREGRVTKPELEGLRADAMKMGSKWLKAHLSVRPRLVRREQDGALEGGVPPTGGDGGREAALSVQNMSVEQLDMVVKAAANTGKTVDEFVAEMNKRSKSITSGASRRGA